MNFRFGLGYEFGRGGINFNSSICGCFCYMVSTTLVDFLIVIDFEWTNRSVFPKWH